MSNREVTCAFTIIGAASSVKYWRIRSIRYMLQSRIVFHHWFESPCTVLHLCNIRCCMPLVVEECFLDLWWWILCGLCFVTLIVYWWQGTRSYYHSAWRNCATSSLWHQRCMPPFSTEYHQCRHAEMTCIGVSSAYIWMLHWCFSTILKTDDVDWGKLNGPMTEPWGTPVSRSLRSAMQLWRN